MTQNIAALEKFQDDVKESQVLWALQDKASGDWVVMDSMSYEETEVMPLWSSEALAKTHCIEEWEDYTPAPIALADWFEFWLEDLVEDDVIVGLNWVGDEDDLELGLSEFTEALGQIEAL
ncbi:DUF2750 domain-containing protein [uncultured Psychromonas sp.]|uniref:DUF2750 domain-containing protein n=1 Tax=uncultured Psychromonas sp. TaxID=173974 RepID=UPI0026046812|nr:DUF2750 domain-containing protein [uncultured Psychromonas sp.]